MLPWLHTSVNRGGPYRSAVLAIRSSARCQNSRASAPLDRHNIFLTLANEDPQAFLHDLVRAHRHCHFNFMDIPLLPCAFIQPYPAILRPVFYFSTMLQWRQRLHPGTPCGYHAGLRGRRHRKSVAASTYAAALQSAPHLPDPCGFFSTKTGFAERQVHGSGRFLP